MREEEKMARDVYNTMYDLWGDEIFANIGEAEQWHFDMMGQMLQTYGLADRDPAQKEIGKFTNVDLQSTYDQLVADGESSREDAFKVGVSIETDDIEDLENAMAITDAATLNAAYGRLLNGSKNHLRAFNRQLN